MKNRLSKFLILSHVFLVLSCQKSRPDLDDTKRSSAEVAVADEITTQEQANEEKLRESLLNEEGMTEEDISQAKDELEDIISTKVSPEYHTLTLKHSGKCLQVAGGAVVAGANIQQEDCTMEDHQQFQLVESEESDYYFLRNAHSGLCITLAGASLDNATNIFQFDCINSDIQKFIFIDQGDGFSIFQNKYSLKCLDVSKGSFSDEGNAIQWECHGNNNQRIKIEKVQPVVVDDEVDNEL